MDDIKKLFKDRVFYIMVAVIIIMSVICARLFQLQVLESETYAAELYVYTEYELPLDAPRGNIYDRNGKLLATNRLSYKIYMINTSDDQDYRDRMYLSLIDIMDKNGDYYYNYLEDYLVYPLAWGEAIDQEEEAAEKKAWINTIVSTKSDKQYFDTPQNAFNFLRERIFAISDEYNDYEAYKIMIFRYATYQYGLDSLKPTCFAKDVCEETVNEISARSLEFNGVTFEKTYYRQYVNCESLGPIIGYVRAISEEEYEEKKELGYYADDVIGKLGIEKCCEDTLRGTRGYRKYCKHPDGTIEDLGVTEPVAGNDIYLTIDINLQQTLYESLEENVKYTASRINYVDNFGDCNAGCGVVSDVNTGEILAMATYPGFDNNIFVSVGDEDAQKAVDELLKDSNSSSLNRCTQCTFPIGSMIKPAIAVAGLESGVTDNNRKITCEMSVMAGGRRLKCLSYHGPVSLENALGRSCNVYFATIGMEMGIETVDYWIKQFGLGESTGIEIDEKVGHRSNPESMELFETDPYHKWTDASTAATCIGQLYTTFTPLQVNRYIASIANGGYLHNMHLIKTVNSPSGSVIYRTEIEETAVGASEENIRLVQNAMTKMVNNYADLRNILSNYPKYFLAGKTGTAQTGTNEQSSHAFYTGYAPYNDPQIAITLMLEHGVYSGNNFATVGAIIDCYFGGSYEEGFKGLNNYYNRSVLVGSGGQGLGRWFN